MDIISALLIAIALAMDAFNVSLSKGFHLKSLKRTKFYGLQYSLEESI